MYSVLIVKKNNIRQVENCGQQEKEEEEEEWKPETSATA